MWRGGWWVLDLLYARFCLHCAHTASCIQLTWTVSALQFRHFHHIFNSPYCYGVMKLVQTVTYKSYSACLGQCSVSLKTLVLLASIEHTHRITRSADKASPETSSRTSCTDFDKLYTAKSLQAHFNFSWGCKGFLTTANTALGKYPVQVCKDPHLDRVYLATFPCCRLLCKLKQGVCPENDEAKHCCTAGHTTTTLQA